MRRRLLIAVPILVALATIAVRAALLGVTPGFPKTSFSNPSAISYVAAGPTGTLSINAKPIATQFTSVVASTALFAATPAATLTINVVLNANGTVAGGVAGDDLVLRGKITVPAGGPTYDGTGANIPLLTGEVVSFGYLDGGPGFADNFDFRFLVTGGQLASYFVGQDLGVTVTSDVGNTFAGVFSLPFVGNAKGNLGPIPPLPQQCTAGIGNFVWHDHNRNGIQDVNEEGIDGVSVTLTFPNNSTQTVQTTTGPTGQHGYYQFSNLCAGNYTVTVTTPAGYAPTTANAPGSTTDNDSNPSPSPVTLPTDSSTDQSIDFGFMTPCTGMIGDFVWADLNGNGIQEPGEPGINNVTVQLLDSVGNVLKTTLTSNSPTTSQPGYYAFDGLCSGNYQVKFINPGGYIGFSPQFQGGDTTLDSNPNPATGVATVSLPADDSTDLTIDAGLEPPCTGAIGDFVWNDLDGDGIQGANEPGINGVKVELKDSFGNVIQTDITHDHPITGAHGYYQFPGVCNGSFLVVVTRPTAYAFFSPSFQGGDTNADSNGTPSQDLVFSIAPVTLPFINSSDQSIDFGFYSCTGSIGDFVWLDLNANGKQDPGEPGIPSVTLALLDGNGGSLGVTTMTNGAGFYEFTGLCPASYQVQVVSGVPAAYVTTTTNAAGTTPANDSNPNPAPVTLPAPNSTDPTIDFGYYQPARIIIDKATTPASDPTLFTFTPSYAAVFYLADASAPHDSGPLAPGTYTVAEAAQPGWDLTSLSCSVNGSNGSTGAQDASNSAQANITLTTGDTVTCTFTNVRRPRLTVIKQIVGGNGTTDAFDVIVGSLVRIDNAVSLAPAGTSSGVLEYTAGSYQITETNGDGSLVNASLWITTFSGDCDASGHVSLAGGDDKTCTVTNTKRASLGDFVWKDLNANGIQEAAEPGIPNVLVTLLNCDGTPTGMTTTTDANGVYGFTNLTPGCYKVQFATPSGYAPSPADQGADDAKDSDAVGGVTGGYTLSAGEHNPTIDAGFYPPQLTVIKKIIGGDGTTDSFDVKVDGVTKIDNAVSTSAGGTSSGVFASSAGPHSVTETNGNGSAVNTSAWTTTFSGDCDAAGNVTLAAGDNKVCTVTNSKLPQLKIVKVLVPSTDQGVFDLSIDVSIQSNNGQGYGNGGTTGFQPVSVGAHTVSELGHGITSLASYTPSISCDNGKGSNSGQTSLTTAALNYGDKVTCTITNTAASFVRIEKVSLGGTGTFSFTDTVPGGPTSITTSTAGVASGSTLVNVPTGSYTVTETGPAAGWNFKSLVCTGGGSNTSIAGQTATIGVDPGETIICTFTNAKQASVRIEKISIGGTGTFGFTNTVPGGATSITTSTASTAAGTTISNVAPGTYTVSESSASGWNFASLNCTGGGGNTTTSGQAATIGVDPGETIVCTYTNKKQASVRIEKVSIGATGTFTFTGNVPGAPTSITTSTAGTAAGTTVANVAPGTYTVSEGSVTSGWTFTSLSCTGGGTNTTTSGQTATIGVDPGEAIVCTYTNTFTAPCVGTTFTFSGSSSSSGSVGNIRTFTSGGVSVKVSAFSRIDSSGSWSTAYLGLYSAGLGVTDGSEGDGSNNRHKVDNMGGRNNYVLFEFSQPVTIDRAFLGLVGADSDISVWIGTKTNPYTNHNTLSDAFLSSLGGREDNTTTSTDDRWANINPTVETGNVLVISALVNDDTPEDEFKISKVETECPQPAGACVAGNYNLTGNTASYGAAGNIRTFTLNGVSVKVSGFSRSDAGSWATAWVGQYGPGMGVTDTSEGDGSNNRHKVDNIGGRNNYLLFEFSTPVVVDKAYLDAIGNDSDFTVWIGNVSNAYTNHQTLSDTFLNNLGYTEENQTSATVTSRWGDFNSGLRQGNIFVISALASDASPEDEFKVAKLSITCK